jgi:hypothetical protein
VHRSLYSDIYVTDYTKNNLFDSILPESLTSFPKKAILKIVIREDNATSQDVSVLKEGKFYYIENLQFNKEGEWVGRMRQQWSSFHMLSAKGEIKNIELKALLE